MKFDTLKNIFQSTAFNMNLNKPFVFFFPFHSVGGVSILFLRLANFISSTFNVETYIVDYPDGYMAKSPRHSKVHLIPYAAEESVTIPNNSILVLQSDLPWGLPKNLLTNQNTTVFFWNCYPFNFIPVLPGRLKDWTSSSLLLTKLILNTLLLPSKHKCAKLVQLAVRHNALAFMDHPNFEVTTQCLGVQIKTPFFLPIMILDPLKEKKWRADQEHLTAVWLGRIADFKIFSLLRVAQDLKTTAEVHKKNVLFYIIGSGDREHILKSQISEGEYFKIVLIPHLSPDDLDPFLIEKADILFAMGTSALEGAKLGIPTILMNFSYSPISNRYKYNHFFETENYSLGDLISRKHEIHGYTMDQILEQLKGSQKELGQKSYSTFSAHHSLQKGIELFFESTQRSSLTYHELMANSFIRKPAFYVLWRLFKDFKQRMT